MFPTSVKSGYSAEVRMQLLLAGRSLSIAQLGPDFIILSDKEVVDLAPCHGVIEIGIDDHERQREVFFPEGIRTGHRIPLAAVRTQEVSG